jgi:hypothetical protein
VKAAGGFQEPMFLARYACIGDPIALIARSL